MANEIFNSVMDECVNVLEDIREEIRRNMAEQGVNASGRTSEGLEVERYESGVRLVLRGENVAPLATLEVGRRAGKTPYGFASILEQWSRDKGLNFGSDGERWRFANALAQKIRREGTERHHENKNVYTDPVNEGVTRLRSNIKAVITEYVHSELNI